MKVVTGIRKDLFLYALILPGFLYFLLFKYVPMWGIVISFQEYSPYLGFWQSPWVGFEHFATLFNNPDFLIIFRNTMVISMMNIVFYFPMPILVALMLNELRLKRFQRVIQSVIYLPHFLSWVIISGITFLLLSQSGGIVNKLLVEFGREPYNFLTNPGIFWQLLTAQSIWKETGWGTIIFLAAMAGIDPQLHEAARIDGAGRIRQIWHVTLPGIRNVIVTLLILRLGNIMDVGFEQVFLMMNSAVTDVADVFETYVYRNGIQQGQFSYSTAVGLFKSVIGLLMVIGANKLAKRYGEEGLY
ncbi:polysaccharide ABC transporter ATP-binding protein [Cohnella sp. CIP 111063]|uniref:ABC transporter permease n=1 Tax=unclassified Cohnella TaxID=2636738 RepID=UPI000B8C27F2|nr:MULTISPECIES: sugar ABC transporter permease [unclassified Cohnella]OXS54048.1 polysaccharide ABC transporter ATP-binding protein [Cohnella sp. CIP 111063]PRX62921.1 carbohydrate ABC transporter membrane protein 1 (CUT1 family) [Cohnella sp. SGD-V74]